MATPNYYDMMDAENRRLQAEQAAALKSDEGLPVGITPTPSVVTKGGMRVPAEGPVPTEGLLPVAEIAAGELYPPLGMALDAKDMAKAVESRDPIAMAMAGVGFLPFIGTGAKAIFKAIRDGDKSAETLQAAKKMVDKYSNMLNAGDREELIRRQIVEADNPDLFSGGLLRPDIEQERLMNFLSDADEDNASIILDQLEAGRISPADAAKQYNDAAQETTNLWVKDIDEGVEAKWLSEQPKPDLADKEPPRRGLTLFPGPHDRDFAERLLGRKLTQDEYDHFVAKRWIDPDPPTLVPDLKKRMVKGPSPHATMSEDEAMSALDTVIGRDQNMQRQLWDYWNSLEYAQGELPKIEGLDPKVAAAAQSFRPALINQLLMIDK